MHKDAEKVLVSEKEIENIVNMLAKRIEKDYNGKDFIMVGLLKGSLIFTADLMRKINLDFEVDFIRASSYRGAESSGRVTLRGGDFDSFRGKNVLIIEDVIDTGITLDFIRKRLESTGACVKVCTLFDKPSNRRAGIEPDYCGMTLGDEFIVGYGMDYNEKYRNLPYVAVLSRSVYS